MIRIAIAALLLTACATQPATSAPGEDCDAGRAQALVGQAGTAELGREALRLTGARTIRWIRPGQMVTMDYSPQRLNIRLDSQDRVEGFSCG